MFKKQKLGIYKDADLDRLCLCLCLGRINNLVLLVLIILHDIDRAWKMSKILKLHRLFNA